MNTIESVLKQNGVYLDNITVDGKNVLVQYFLQTKTPNIIIYEDSEFNTLATLDITKELRPKILSKGVFEIEDEDSKKPISIQFYKSLPLDLT